jgi:hypothetical protein
LKRFALGLAGKERKLAVPAGLYTWEGVASHRAFRHPLATGKRNLPVGTRMGAQRTAGAPGLPTGTEHLRGSRGPTIARGQ